MKQGLKSVLEWYKNTAGVSEVYSTTPIDRTISNTNLDSGKKSTNQSLTNMSSRDLANQATTLEELREIVHNYNGCAIKKTALHTVFGDGSPKASVMFIGEAPGANEDKYGIPFCGQSGKLLNNILLSIGLKREEVYITNTIFWRPPGNRRPTLEELHQCRPFVEKHIGLINPKLIVLVGSTAVESLLDSKVSMHTLRDGLFEYTNPYLKHKIKTFVIFHPSYLLRQPAKKKLMWYDMLKVKDFLSKTNDNNITA
jgi:DNA polymerase